MFSLQFEFLVMRVHTIERVPAAARLRLLGFQGRASRRRHPANVFTLQGPIEPGAPPLES